LPFDIIQPRRTWPIGNETGRPGENCDSLMLRKFRLLNVLAGGAPGNLNIPALDLYGSLPTNLSLTGKLNNLFQTGSRLP
jgi:hypothetical protein